MREFLSVSPEVADALRSRRPMVAFESTIISHGMPYPRNRETAQAAEAIARAQGVVPATVALLDGKITVGLSPRDLERLSTEKDVLKVSRRDLAWALGSRRTGATTVSATMIAARLAGIDVFATGGIGGVHRGASDSFDVSADLTELAATSVCVVAAGAKAILDLPKTLEVLETLGVPVVGFQTTEFPAFYSRSSGLPVPLHADTPAQIAGMLNTQRGLGLPQGILVANPVPAESEIPRATMEAWIEQALRDLAGARGARQGMEAQSARPGGARQGMEAQSARPGGARQGTEAQSARPGGAPLTGKAVTPFLLARIVELSGGASLDTNVALFHNNVRLACRIAAACAAEGSPA